ncbi:MAG: hypothetical protein RIS53_203, partial [Bacillota bacterium]
MGKIKILDSQLSNMIAAGEVVERPASAIKELIENAIDANATRIDISVEHAGRILMEVRDNGEGMDRDDLSQSILRHATSKIKDEYDLFRIKTLGFRGEALPSIASVSQLTIESSTGKGPGYQLKAVDGIVEIIPISSRKGTSVKVENLFFNTPVRLKFLKNDYVETANIIDVVSRIALGFPNISFSLYIDGKNTFVTDGRGNVLQVISQIFGIQTAKQLIPFTFASQDVNVKGFLGLPSLAKSHRYSMYTLVNGRSVTLPKINQALLEAYRPFLPPVRYPWLFLHFMVDPSLVDVNVHPTKKEVRLSKEDQLKTSLVPAIRNVLSALNLAPSESKIINQHSMQTPQHTSSPNNELRESDSTIDWIPLELNALKSIQQLTVVAQLHLTYIVCRDEQGSIYLIDQHAADERVRYEEQLGLLKDKKFAVTPLVPVMVEIKPNEAKLLTEERMQLLSSIGVELAPFGAKAFKVNTVPTWAIHD